MENRNYTLHGCRITKLETKALPGGEDHRTLLVVELVKESPSELRAFIRTVQEARDCTQAGYLHLMEEPIDWRTMELEVPRILQLSPTLEPVGRSPAPFPAGLVSVRIRRKWHPENGDQFTIKLHFSALPDRDRDSDLGYMVERKTPQGKPYLFPFNIQDMGSLSQSLAPQNTTTEPAACPQ